MLSGFRINAREQARSYGGIEDAIDERTGTLSRTQTNESYYHALVDLITDYAYIFVVAQDNAFIYEWVNESFEQTTGFTLAEVRHHEGWSGMIHPDDLEIVHQRKERLLSGQRDISEFRIIAKHGDVRWLCEHSQPEWDDAHMRVVRIYGAAQDITEQRTLQEQLLRQQHALAALRERESRARALHNGMGQVLGHIHTYAETVQTLLARGAVDEANATLTDLINTAQETLDDIRECTAPSTNTANGTMTKEPSPLQNKRVLLVDHQPLFLEGLRTLLAMHNIPVVGIAGDGLEGLDKARTLRPDIILMDVDMPNGDGLEVIRRIKEALPNVQMVMLAVAAEEEHVFEAIKSGASGYLLKSLDVGDFLALLSDLERGEIVLTPAIASKVLTAFARQVGGERQNGMNQQAGERDPLTCLNTRQRTILSLVAQGCTYREVGEELNLSESTIKYHMGSIMRILQLKNRADAVEYARKRGLDKA